MVTEWLPHLQDPPRNEEGERQGTKGTNQSNLLPFKELSWELPPAASAYISLSRARSLPSVAEAEVGICRFLAGNCCSACNRGCVAKEKGG